MQFVTNTGADWAEVAETIRVIFKDHSNLPIHSAAVLLKAVCQPPLNNRRGWVLGGCQIQQAEVVGVYHACELKGLQSEWECGGASRGGGGLKQGKVYIIQDGKLYYNDC